MTARPGAGAPDTADAADAAEEIVAAYLDALLLALRGHPREVRSMLAETEAHLRDAIAAAVAGGADPETAARGAVGRFGPVAVVARHANRAAVRRPTGLLARQLGLVLGTLAAVGLLAIGLSGAVAAAMTSTLGARFTAGDPPGVTYTPDRCAEYLEYEPHARTCAEAAARHHAGEVEDYRLAAGVVGLMAGAAVGVVRRRWRTTGAVGVLPAGFTATIGAAVFGVAGAVLIVQAAGPIVTGESDGAGQWLSGALVALAVAAAFATSLIRTLTNRQPAPSVA